MQRMVCWECSRGTATPQAGPPSVDQTVFEFAICLDCLDRLRQDSEAAKAAGEAIYSGTVCALCLAALAGPGGYVVWALDDAHLLKLCSPCKEKAEWGHRDEPA